MATYQSKQAALCVGLIVMSALCGCQTDGTRSASYAIVGSSDGHKKSTARLTKKSRRDRTGRIRYIRCLYDQKPWVSADKAGDRDPEGIHYRVFLQPVSKDGFSKSVLQDGELYIEMYRIDRERDGTTTRVLVSDWRYPTSTFQPLRSKVLGMGYHIWLRWAKKSLAGKDVEFVTWFEDSYGKKVRSSTKRFLVPSYVP